MLFKSYLRALRFILIFFSLSLLISKLLDPKVINLNETSPVFTLNVGQKYIFLLKLILTKIHDVLFSWFISGE